MSRTVLILFQSPHRWQQRPALRFPRCESVGNKAVSCTCPDENRTLPACEYCHEKSDGVCVIRDDMGSDLGRTGPGRRRSLRLPIYFFDCSAQLKLVIDRLYARYEQMQVENSALLLTCGAEEDVAESAMILYRKLGCLLRLPGQGHSLRH